MTTILAAATTITQILLPLVVISLSMAIPIVAIITEHFQKKERMRLMEKAIEHGADLSSLQMDEPQRPRMPYRGGMVTAAVGAGLLLVDRYKGWDVHGFVVPLAVAGFICVGVGVALIVNDWINRDRYRAEAEALSQRPRI